MTTIELPAQLKAKNAQGRYEILCQNAAWDARKLPVEAIEFQWKAGEGIYAPVWYLHILPSGQEALLCCFAEDLSANDSRPHCLRRTIGICNKMHLNVITALAQGTVPKEMNFDSRNATWSISIESGSEDASAWKTGILYDGGRSERYTLRSNLLPEKSGLISTSPLPSPAPKHRKSCLLPLLPWLLFMLALGVISWLYDTNQQQVAELQACKEKINRLNRDNAKVPTLHKEMQDLIKENEGLRKSLKAMPLIRKHISELHSLLNENSDDRQPRKSRSQKNKQKHPPSKQSHTQDDM